MCARTKVPSNYRDLALLVVKYQNDFYNALNLEAEELLTTLEHVDAFRRPDRFEDFLLSCEAGSKKVPSQQIAKFRAAYKIAVQVPVQPLLEQGLTGADINRALHQQRKILIASNYGGQ